MKLSRASFITTGDFAANSRASAPTSPDDAAPLEPRERDIAQMLTSLDHVGRIVDETPSFDFFQQVAGWRVSPERFRLHAVAAKYYRAIVMDSGNTERGVRIINDSASFDSNKIGTNAAGTGALANGNAYAAGFILALNCDLRVAGSHVHVVSVVAQVQFGLHRLPGVAPRGGRVHVPGRLAVLPRKVLDALLCEAAVLAGARMYAPLRFVEPLVEFDRVVGARLRGRDAVRDVRCRWVVLATGAVPQALISAGVCERQLPSGIALRGYVRNPRMAGRIGTLDIVWHKALRPGYGWLFPCGEGLFNIGVGVAQSHQARPGGGTTKRGDVNLRDLFDTFTALHAPARDLMADGEWEGELKGAPLRCSLTGAAFSRPGLLVTGEAAGSTYSFTGEGIGKALETGMLCAESIIVGGDDDAMTRSDYASRLARLKPRFDLYERANQVNAHPWLADLLVWRARKSPRIVDRMAGVLEETSNPGNLVSLRGVARLFTG